MIDLGLHALHALHAGHVRHCRVRRASVNLAYWFVHSYDGLLGYERALSMLGYTGVMGRPWAEIHATTSGLLAFKSVLLRTP
jgi:hypothetical protein